MELSPRNKDMYKALLLSITGDIKSNPKLKQFCKATQEPLKLSGIGKVTVPVVVWDALKDDEALTNEWDVTFENAEFTINKR